MIRAMQVADRGVGSNPAVASKKSRVLNYRAVRPTGMPGHRAARLRIHYLGADRETSTVRVGMAGPRQRHPKPEAAPFRPGKPDLG